jgi:hypothetical protein
MTLQAIAVKKPALRFDSIMDPPRQVALREAVRQRIDLHPQAGVQEIAAMLEYDGVRVPASLVQEILNQRRALRFKHVGLVHAPPAVRLS